MAFHMALVLQNAKMDISSSEGIASLLLGLFCSIYKAVRPHSCASITAHVCNTCMYVSTRKYYTSCSKEARLSYVFNQALISCINKPHVNLNIYSSLSPSPSFSYPQIINSCNWVPLTLTLILAEGTYGEAASCLMSCSWGISQKMISPVEPTDTIVD